MARKPRSDAILKNLPPHQKEQLIRWLTEEGLSYEEAQERLRMDFGVEVGKSTIGDFYATECWLLSSQSAHSFAEQVEAELKKGEEHFDTATIALVRERAFVLAKTKGSSVKDLATLAGIIGESTKLRLKARELLLAEAKFRETIKSQVEKGLEALYDEIKGYPAAVELFERLKAAVLRSVEGKTS